MPRTVLRVYERLESNKVQNTCAAYHAMICSDRLYDAMMVVRDNLWLARNVEVLEKTGNIRSQPTTPLPLPNIFTFIISSIATAALVAHT